MDEPKEIVKSNIDRYNKKLAYHDGILLISLLFILINYFLVTEPNYSAKTELIFRTKKIESLNNNIEKQKRSIIKKIPENGDAYGTGISNNMIVEKLTRYLNKDQWDSVQFKLDHIKQTVVDNEFVDQERTYLWDSIQFKLNDIKDADKNVENLKQKNSELKNNISNSGDLLSVVKILLFINDGRTHFALFLSYVVLIIIFYFTVSSC